MVHSKYLLIKIFIPENFQSMLFWTKIIFAQDLTWIKTDNEIFKVQNLFYMCVHVE